MRSAGPLIFGGVANAESHAGSLHPLVSPWIRAALVRDAGWLALRGQRDARSIRENLSEKINSLLTATICVASIYA